MNASVIALAVIISVGLSLAVACLAAWALTAIWPSLPFWTVTILAWLIVSVFSRSSASSS